MSLLNIYSVKEESILIKDIPYIFRDNDILAGFRRFGQNLENLENLQNESIFRKV